MYRSYLEPCLYESRIGRNPARRRPSLCTALSRCPSLRRVDLRDCSALQDVCELAECAALEDLNLSGCQQLSRLAALKWSPTLRRPVEEPEELIVRERSLVSGGSWFSSLRRRCIFFLSPHFRSIFKMLLKFGKMNGRYGLGFSDKYYCKLRLQSPV